MCLAELDPIEAYTHLTVAIELSAMKYPPGKRQEYEFCRDKAQHTLMALYQDYDWADEVLHSHFGQEWIVKGEHGGDRRAVEQVGRVLGAPAYIYVGQTNGKPAGGNGDQPGKDISETEQAV